MPVKAQSCPLLRKENRMGAVASSSYYGGSLVVVSSAWSRKIDNLFTVSRDIYSKYPAL